MMSSLSLNAQVFVPAYWPEVSLPLSSDSAVKEKIYNTSSYSFENVDFNVSETPTPEYKPMDLYVYSWSVGAVNGSGIAYSRINSLTGAGEDKGFVPVPSEKNYTEVGIIQDENHNTFVIALWNGQVLGEDSILFPGTYYDLYKWTNTNLSLVSEINPINVYYGDTSKSSMGRRVSMDCQHLNKVIFCWEEVPSGSSLNPGGIFLKSLKVAGTPPFVVSPIFRLAGIPTSGTHYPDVAFAENGNTIRVAFRTQSPIVPTEFDLNVVNLPFSTFTSYPAVPPLMAISSFYSTPFSTDYFHPNMIIETPFPYAGFTNVNDQISLDCPDNFDIDVWAVTVGSAGDIWAVQKPVGLPVIVKNLTLMIPEKNLSPVVSFHNPMFSQGINYAWYNYGGARYLATQLDYSGNYIAPTDPNTFFLVSNYGMTTALKGAMRPTLSRNNAVLRGMLAAYPFNISTPSLFEMRHKIVPIPSGSFKYEVNPKIDHTSTHIVNIAPNPINLMSEVSIKNYKEDELLSWQIVDAKGSKILSVQNTNLNALNNMIQQAQIQWTAGIYFLHIEYQQKFFSLKLIKQ